MSEDKYVNSYKYFENRECKYYPCHDREHINCMFCYCPLYGISNCPGNYVIVEKEGRKIKSCINCEFPHKAENFDKIMGIIRANNEKIDGN